MCRLLESSHCDWVFMKRENAMVFGKRFAPSDPRIRWRAMDPMATDMHHFYQYIRFDNDIGSGTALCPLFRVIDLE